MLGNKLTGHQLDFSSSDFFLWTGVMSADFKIDNRYARNDRFIRATTDIRASADFASVSSKEFLDIWATIEADSL